MARELKEIIVSDFSRKFEGIAGGVLINYHGINAEMTLDLRSTLRKDGVRMRVIQNRLAQRVLLEKDGVPDGLKDILQGPCALLIGEDGALTASKSITNWRKKNKTLGEIKGGFVPGRVLSVEDVAQMATIPDQATLQSQVASLFISPAQILASCAQSVLSHFAGCVKARHGELEG